MQAYTNVNTNPDTALAVLYTAAAELFTSDPDTDQAAVAVTQARTLAPGHKPNGSPSSHASPPTNPQSWR
ncbi:MAG TPA: hypothetical protein VES60_17230 [Nakamurella sp.]|nr:hypothetical protein [Nakamurella sp.]